MASVIDAKRNDKLDLHSLPAALRPVLRRATSSDPAKRYGSCREMVRELRRAMEQSDELGEAVLAARGRGAGRFVFAAVIVAIVGAGGVWAWRNYMPNDEAVATPVKTSGEPPKLVSSGNGNSGLSANGPPVKGTGSNVGPSTEPDPAEAARREGESLLASGTEFLKKHDFVRASADLERAGKLVPRNFHVFSRLGARLGGAQSSGRRRSRAATRGDRD